MSKYSRVVAGLIMAGCSLAACGGEPNTGTVVLYTETPALDRGLRLIQFEVSHLAIDSLYTSATDLRADFVSSTSAASDSVSNMMIEQFFATDGGQLLYQLSDFGFENCPDHHLATAVENALRTRGANIRAILSNADAIIVEGITEAGALSANAIISYGLECDDQLFDVGNVIASAKSIADVLAIPVANRTAGEQLFVATVTACHAPIDPDPPGALALVTSDDVASPEQIAHLEGSEGSARRAPSGTTPIVRNEGVVAGPTDPDPSTDSWPKAVGRVLVNLNFLESRAKFEALPGDCNDNVDNDGDGKKDGQDDTCSSPMTGHHEDWTPEEYVSTAGKYLCEYVSLARVAPPDVDLHFAVDIVDPWHGAEPGSPEALAPETNWALIPYELSAAVGATYEGARVHTSQRSFMHRGIGCGFAEVGCWDTQANEGLHERFRNQLRLGHNMVNPDADWNVVIYVAHDEIAPFMGDLPNPTSGNPDDFRWRLVAYPAFARTVAPCRDDGTTLCGAAGQDITAEGMSHEMMHLFQACDQYEGTLCTGCLLQGPYRAVAAGAAEGCGNGNSVSCDCHGEQLPDLMSHGNIVRDAPYGRRNVLSWYTRAQIGWGDTATLVTRQTGLGGYPLAQPPASTVDGEFLRGAERLGYFRSNWEPEAHRWTSPPYRVDGTANEWLVPPSCPTVFTANGAPSDIEDLSLTSFADGPALREGKVSQSVRPYAHKVYQGPHMIEACRRDMPTTDGNGANLGPQ